MDAVQQRLADPPKTFVELCRLNAPLAGNFTDRYFLVVALAEQRSVGVGEFIDALLQDLVAVGRLGLELGSIGRQHA